MVRVQGTLQSSEPTGPLPLHAIFLRAQPKSELFSNAAAEPDVSHHSLPKCLGLKSGFDRTTGRSAEENRLSASVPTLTPFDFQYNKSGFSVSSATLLLLTQILVCCIDRLNPQHIAVTRCAGMLALCGLLTAFFIGAIAAGMIEVTERELLCWIS